MTTIDKFEGEFSFLSNFHESGVSFHGVVFPTMEHFFQAMKTKIPKERNEVVLAATPGQAKRIGRRVTLRDDWEKIKVSIMTLGIRLKFAQHQDLADKLLATGDAELIEGNTWHDNCWGNCSCERCAAIQGENNLGKILMNVREEIRIERMDTDN